MSPNLGRRREINQKTGGEEEGKKKSEPKKMGEKWGKGNE